MAHGPSLPEPRRKRKKKRARMRGTGPGFRFIRWRREAGLTKAQTVARSLSSGLTDTPGDPQDHNPGGRFFPDGKSRVLVARVRSRLRSPSRGRGSRPHTGSWRPRGTAGSTCAAGAWTRLLSPVTRYGVTVGTVHFVAAKGKDSQTGTEFCGPRSVRKRTAAPRSRPLSERSQGESRGIRPDGGGWSRGRPDR